MSGGRFNYINDTCQNEIFGYFYDDERLPNIFEDREITELIYDVFNLIHEYDWYASGDTGKDTWLGQKKAFKQKWLNNRGVRVKRIVDDAIADCKAELYETYGLEDDR